MKIPGFFPMTGLFLLATSCASLLQAHTEPGSEKAAVSASAAASWRSAGAVHDDALWRIPGIQLGGDALPAEAGTSLDDAILNGYYRIDPQNHIAATLMQHTGHDLTLEHAWFQHRTPLGGSPAMALSLSLGEMPGRFSPGASWHSSTGIFSEAPLINDAFIGRHFSDRGLRVEAEIHHFRLGLEHWKGEHFPATSQESAGNRDFYLHFQLPSRNKFKLQTGAWMMQARSLMRMDERYTANGTGHSHSHGSTSLLPSSLPVPVGFSGQTELAGGWLDLEMQWQKGLRGGLYGELVQADIEGNLLETDTPQMAWLTGDYRGFTLEPFLEKGRHRLSFRHEKLLLDNHLTGLTATTLAQQAGLAKSNRDPRRRTLQWRYQLHPSLALRIAYIDDQSITDPAISAHEQSQNRWVLGLRWQQTLWQKRTRPSPAPDHH